MLRRHALSQSQRLCKHLQRLQSNSEVTLSVSFRPVRCFGTLATFTSCSSATACCCAEQGAAHPAEQSGQAGDHSSLYSACQHASTATQVRSHDQLAGPRLDVEAPLPRFLPQSGKPEGKKNVKQPVGVQQAIEEVQVSITGLITQLLQAMTERHDMTQANAKARFDETVEVAINLGTNPKRGDQAVRGTALLPFGTGKALRIAAFAEGEDAVAATAAGVSWHSAILPAKLALHALKLPAPASNQLLACSGHYTALHM